MKKVLIVDDSKTILKLLKQEIEKYDFIEAYFAQSFKDAVKLIRGHQGDFQAALLDLNLPDAQNGEIVRLANSHKIPAVILSATADKDLKESILERDLVDFVLKDDPSSISFAVKSILRTLKNYDTSILIVDDSLVYRSALVNILKKLHLKIFQAQDGIEALEVLAKNPQISLLITDYEMPRMNGHELTFKIRETQKKINSPS